MDQRLERCPAITPGLPLSKGEFTRLWKWVPDAAESQLSQVLRLADQLLAFHQSVNLGATPGNSPSTY